MRSISEAILQSAVILMAGIMLIETAVTDHPDDDAIAHAAQGIARVIETMAAPRPS